MDQVPAGLYDPKFTYNKKGAGRVHIASNGSADSHRFCTLQVCVRNLKDPSLPRCGQPRLCMCFRGTGTRIGERETEQYHPDVVVLWQPKAWFDSNTCNKWIPMYAMHEIKKTELGVGQRHLILCDNLSGRSRSCSCSCSCSCCPLSSCSCCPLSSCSLPLLSGQTRKTNPTFAKMLDQHCRADVFNLLAGHCTDTMRTALTR